MHFATKTLMYAQLHQKSVFSIAMGLTNKIIHKQCLFIQKPLRASLIGTVFILFPFFWM